jgi:hypothetical protein
MQQPSPLLLFQPPSPLQLLIIAAFSVDNAFVLREKYQKKRVMSRSDGSAV